MKTVKATPTSSKPITLSKAAKILSQFVSVENGASQAISAYLKRASAAFNELHQLHKDIRNPHSDRKHKPNKSDNVVKEKDVVENESIQFGDKQGKHQKLIKEEEDRNHCVSRSGKGLNPAVETKIVIEDGIENHKEKKKKGKPGFEAKNSGDYEDDMRDEDELKPAFLQIGKIHENKVVEKKVMTEDMSREERKKRKKVDVEDRQEDGSRELHSKKKRRKKSEDDK